VKSGNCKHEAALFGVQQVVCYKEVAVSVAIAKLVADVKYISLVNLILDAQQFKELIQRT
jgi:lipid-A-disaccharide synthase